MRFVPFVLLGVMIQFPWYVSSLFFLFWLVFFLLDIKSTIGVNEFIKYETNVMMKLFSHKFSPKKSLALQIVFEIIVIFIGSIFDLRLDMSSMSIVAFIFGIVHMIAWHSNKKCFAVNYKL